MPATTVRGWLRQARAAASRLHRRGIQMPTVVAAGTFGHLQVRDSPLAQALDTLIAATVAVLRHPTLTPHSRAFWPVLTQIAGSLPPPPALSR